MDRVYEAGAVLVPPSAPVAPSTGYPTAGSPVGGVSATKPGPWWFHMMTEELRAVIAAAGLTPDHAVLNQLLQALPGALASRPEWSRSLTTNGYQKIGDRLLWNWGTVGPVTTGSITLPQAYANSSAYRVFLQPDAASGTFSTSANRTSGSQFSYILNASANMHWHAIGYLP